MNRQEEFIKQFYNTKKNFKVEDNPRAEEPDLAVIYFSSLGIYTDENYMKALTSDYYEFHRNPIRRAGRHIYVRDVCRAFYLNGINSNHFRDHVAAAQRGCQPTQGFIGDAGHGS